MKASVLTGPKRCETMDLPDPSPGGDLAVIRISACGICGSDTHYWELGVGMDGKPGLVLGHEFSGRIADPGSLSGFSAGTRVTVIPMNPCGECAFCRDKRPNLCIQGSRRPLPGLNSPGAYAEYCAVRPDMVRSLPDSVSDRDAALIEPASVALHAVKTADVRPGHTVLVSGGGPVGLLSAMWASHAGASAVILSEVDPFRIEFAKQRSYITEVMDAKDPGFVKAVKKATGGVDRVIETSAADPGLHAGIGALKSGGIIVLAGISMKPQSVPTLLMTVKEIRMMTVFGYTVDEFDECLSRVSSGTVDVSHLISRTVSLDRVQEVFEHLVSGSMGDVKVLIEP